MNSTSCAQFVSAGIQLYPQCGYGHLSEEAVIKRVCSNMAEFRAVFADKDEFMKAVLSEYRERVLGRVSFDCVPGNSEVECFRQIVWRLAVTMRNNLHWLHRMLLDSAGGVAVISQALKANNEQMAVKLMEMIQKCHGGERLSQLDLANRYDFLQGAVFMPMIVDTSYQMFGILSDELSVRMPDLMSDEVIRQRIDWVAKALFGR